jgi:poly(A) polymerase
MPVGGSDVLALGVPPGPAVGNVLKAFETWWVASGFTSDRSEQAAKLKALAASAIH